MLRLLVAFLLLFSVSLCALSSGGPVNTDHEIVYVGIDRDYHVAGDNLHFQLYLLADAPQKVPRSEFAYIALRSVHGVVDTQVLKLTESIAGGTLKLPDTLSTGYYEIVAFTRWMKNFGEETFFRRQIFVANGFDKELKALQEKSIDGEPEIIVYAHGNTWVHGQSQQFLLMLKNWEDAAARPVYLLNNNTGDTLKKIRLSHEGFTTFDLAIYPEQEYVFSFGRNVIPWELTNPTDFAFSVQERNGFLDLYVVGEKDSLQSIELELIIESGAGKIIEQEISLQGAGDIISIPLAELPRGLLSIQLTSRETRAERIWYHEKEKKATSLVSPPLVPTATSVNFDLYSSGTSVMHMAVVPSEGIASNRVQLTPYLRAYSLWQNGLISQARRDKFMQMDLNALNNYLLMPLDAKPMDSRAVKEDRPFKMETSTRILRGKVMEQAGEKGVANARVILNTPGSEINLQYADTDDEGVFHFALPAFYHGKQLYFSMYPGESSGKRIIAIDDVFEFKNEFVPVPFADAREKSSFLERMQKISSVNRSFNLDFRQGIREWEKETDTLPNPYPIFSKPNLQIKPSDYLSLDDLQEISLELIPVWRISRSGESYRNRLICASTENALTGEPVFFIDGVIEFDVAKLIALGSDDIDVIHVLNEQWVYGDMRFSGIVSVVSKRRVVESIYAENDKYVLLNPRIYELGFSDYSGREFSRESENRIPYLRPSLYWFGGIKEKGSEEISFYSGDLKGEYVVSIEGVDEHGNPFFQQVPLDIY